MKNLASFRTHTLYKWNVPILAAIVALGLALCCSNAPAQSGAGSIQGTVADSSGAVIPGASIHVVNQATGVAVDTKSNSVGFYQVPGLFTGTYTVTISATGMKTYVRTIELLVEQNAVINATMTPGAVTQQIQISADLVQLTTTTSGVVGSTLENARINQLPMNGRNLITLINETTPGLDSCIQGASCPNGLMAPASEGILDGVTQESREMGGMKIGQNYTPDPDSVQEVRTETAGVGAEYESPELSVITTKSGTNELHGSFFETARNNAWGIAKQRQDPSNLVAPHLVRNEFGASVGGPIVIPHLYLGKNKSFFFFAYERYSLATTSYALGTVPTQAMRNGDWSGLTNSSSVLQQLYDPNTTAASSNCNGTGTTNAYCRAPFLNNQIPLSRLSPTTQVRNAITPLPTTAANPLVTTNFESPNPQLTVIPNVTFRLDHAFNENNHVYLRFTSEPTTSYSQELAPQPVTLAATVNGVTYPYGADGLQSTPDALYAAAIGFTHSFSPTFFSETIVGQQWLKSDSFMANATTDYEKELGLPNSFGEAGFPAFADSLNAAKGQMVQFGYTQIIYNIDENLTKTLGKHQLHFGGRFKHERFGYLNNQQPDSLSFGAYATALENPSSNTNYTATSNTGYAYADEFIGGTASYSNWLQPPYVHFHDMRYAAYFQDDYHVARNLTLNLGLRYEAYPAPWMKYGTIVGFDLKNDAEVLGAPQSTLIAEGYTTQAILTNMQNDGAKFETPQEAGLPSSLMNNYYLNFSPRVGFAWQPFGKWGTVIRGAYGRFTYPVPTYFTMDSVGQNDPFEANYSQSYINAAQSPDSLPNYLLRAPQTKATPWTYSSAGATPVMGVNTTNIVNTSSTTAIAPGIVNTSIDPDDAPDYVTEANFTIEQPLKGNSVLRVSWVYAHDANLYNKYDYNSHPSTYVWEMKTGTVPPAGNVVGSNQYATTATGPYDQTTWGSNVLVEKTSWSTDNQLQANYQRLFHRGIAYQIGYMWSKPMETSAENGTDGPVFPSADYAYSSVSTMTPYGTLVNPALPPPQPAGTAPYAYYKALNRFQNYRVDTHRPKQEIHFNGIVDLPFGRGKRFIGNANRFVDEVAGGWQIAGDGTVASQDFTVGTANYGPTNPLKVYKHSAPITDCRSGVCYKENEWFNGYIAPTANANTGFCTNSKCVSGLPGNWAPYSTPMDNTPGDKYYGSNEVSITLPGKSPADIAYSPGPATNPYAKTVLNGPFNWTADVSLFKVFPITEQMKLSFNVDAFNVFNVQGENTPNATDGTESFLSSYNAARQLQFTLRLTF